MKAYVLPITVGTPHSLFACFEAVLRTVTAGNSLIKAGYAYATWGGVDHFTSHVKSLVNWQATPKQFLIGIHHGITEPSALEILRGLNKSEVRIFVPGGRLTPDSLMATPLFHPKVLAITSANGSQARFLQAGSPNLTASAIGKNPRNYELAIALEARQTASVVSSGAFRSWWSRIWRESRVADKTLIARYAAVRLDVLRHNPILRHAAGPPSNISAARYFFAEVGAASGPPGLRHQIEFPESLANFFGKPKRYRRDLTLRSGGGTWAHRPLSYKETTFGVEIWRLGMPTQNAGGDPIAHRAIRFRRTSQPDTFEFEVVDADSDAFDDWTRAANAIGHLGTTHGQAGRQYGFY